MLTVGAACTASPDGGIGAATLNLGPAFEGRYIVVLEDTADARGVAASAGVRPDYVYEHAIRGFAAPLPAHALEGLLRNPRVRFVDPDREVSASAQVMPTGIRRIGADVNPIARIDGIDEAVDVDVAVLDTGIDLDHPDLNVVAGVHLSSGANKGGEDGNGHGTHVAGTIAARDNGIGVVGVAPGARLYAVKVLSNSGSGSWASIVAGIDWVTARADVIEVANMSLGGGGFDDVDGGDCHASTASLHLAICRSVDAGIVYAVAAGNEADDAANHVPSSYDEVITVSALADFDGAPGALGSGSFAFSSCTESADDSFACFSNFGADVDVLAPGVGIYSTYKAGGYATLSGTSMASPHVAGVAALYVAANGAPSDAAGVRAVAAALRDGASLEPCHGGGACSDDPDGVQEPLPYVGLRCVTGGDCDDASPCTEDACGGDGVCRHAPVVDGTACEAGLCCAGACAAPACASDAGCDDGEACTEDRCLDAGTCAAACVATWPACGAADLCCGPSCAAGSDEDCVVPCTPKGGACTTDGECCSDACNTRTHRCR